MRLIGIDDVNTMNWENIKTISDFDGDSSISDDLTLPAHGQNGSGDGTNSSARYIDEKNISEISAGHPTTSTSLLIESLVQLLCVCLEKDPKVSEESYRVICEQLSKINLIDDSYAMKEFEEMRSQYQMQIYKIIRAVGGHTIPKSLPTVTVGTTHPIETCWSRYHREFEEVEYIAGGGFGRVFKARHKLDCIEYAIKQIKIHSTTIKLCHLAEVKTIASLNHPNVVQYKAAWLEPYVSNNNSSNLMDSETYNASEFETNNTSSAAPSLNNMDLRRPTNDDTSSFIQFERSENNSADTDKSKSRNQILCKYDSASLEESQCRKQNLAILYIQMSLCQMTLKNWLDNRNACNSLEEYYFEYFNKRNERSHLDIVHDIFFQILSGLNYIHSRGIIHHDIKPSNIFLELDSDGRITAQLGDFGLACPLQDGHQGIILGTPLYAAPEQLNGECNPKSDIYSLGIVLIELLIKFGTNMERVRTIESARKGTLPSFLNKKSIHLLQSLLSDEAIRPNTKDLMEVFWKINLEQNVRAFRAAESYNSLQHDKKITELLNQIKVLHDNTETINREKQDLEDRVAEQSNEISELTNALSEKDREIALLRMQLLHYECSS